MTKRSKTLIAGSCTIGLALILSSSGPTIYTNTNNKSLPHYTTNYTLEHELKWKKLAGEQEQELKDKQNQETYIIRMPNKAQNVTLASRGMNIASVSKENVHVLDMRTKFDVSEQELNKCLENTGLQGLAPAYLHAQEKRDINVLFLVSISALESGWGNSPMAHRKNNIFGFGDMSFNTKSDCIYYVSDYLSKYYLSSDGKYFNGYTIKDINCSYCELDSWSPKVINIMQELITKIQEMRQ